MFGRDASTYDDDDAEADEIWAQIDERMDSRRRDARERREREQMEKFRDENPKIVETFRDLKRGLKDVSYAEWDAIPDIGDYTIKKKKLNVGFMPAPDTLLAKALAEKEADGMAKLIYRSDTQEILGMWIMGLHAADLIHEASNAVNQGMKASDLKFAVHAHPTLAEVVDEVFKQVETYA